MNGVVVRFPGSNCSHDVFSAMERVGISTSYLWHKDTRLESNIDLIVVPGGFSWGDYLRSGALSAHSPIMPEIKTFARKGGSVIGICNGFQILCESGLLPGALLINRHMEFICAPQYLRVNQHASPLLQDMKTSPVNFPVAHYAGNYFIDDAGYNRLRDNDRIAFYYADKDGTVSTGANPNGSMHNIAGVSNATGNVLGLMPHPERAMEPLNRPTDGTAFWRSVFRSFRS